METVEFNAEEKNHAQAINAWENEGGNCLGNNLDTFNADGLD